MKKALFVILMVLLAADLTFAEEIRLTTIVPDQTVLRSRKGAIGGTYSNPGTIADEAIPNSSLLVEGRVDIRMSAGAMIDNGPEASLRLGDDTNPASGGQLRGISGGGLRFTNADDTITYMEITPERVRVNGNFFVDGSAGGVSDWNDKKGLCDKRLKKNIVQIEGALDKVTKLRGVRFEWKDAEKYPAGPQLGLIAQDVKEVVPEIVGKNGEYYSLATVNLVPLLIEAVKEQQKEIESLKREVAEIRSSSKK